MGLSRSSYITFEQGKTELNFPQMAKLADIFGISLEQVESGIKPNYEKYKQMILAYLREAASSDGKNLNKIGQDVIFGGFCLVLRTFGKYER